MSKSKLTFLHLHVEQQVYRCVAFLAMWKCKRNGEIWTGIHKTNPYHRRRLPADDQSSSLVTRHLHEFGIGGWIWPTTECPQHRASSSRDLKAKHYGSWHSLEKDLLSWLPSDCHRLVKVPLLFTFCNATSSPASPAILMERPRFLRQLRSISGTEGVCSIAARAHRDPETWNGMQPLTVFIDQV